MCRPHNRGMLLERDAQLTALREYAEDARAGRGRLVLVSGEAGIGKTVLVEEFERSVGLRALHGACDGLFTPRPLGPLYDVAAEVGGELQTVCRSGRPREDLFAALLTTLSHEPTLLVLEDLHWADEATLDLVRYLGRRLATITAVVAVTYRDDGLWPNDPLRVVLGELAGRRTTRRIDLAPLSPGAVDHLAGRAATSGSELFRLTGGNPFFITEVLRGGLGTIPPSARDAVLARVARLSGQARRTAEAAALLGSRVDLELLEAAARIDPADLDELVASGLLVSEPAGLRFRHELTRMTIAQEIPAHRAAAIHGAALTVLVERGADDARLSYHAEGAADAQAVQWFAPRAAERSAELGSHREAVAQLERALRFTHGLAAKEVAALWTQLSVEAGLVDRWDRSEAAIHEALMLWRQVGDPLRIGAALTHQATAQWRLCKQEAWASAQEAVRVLEPLGDTPELARALVGSAPFQKEPGAMLEVARRAEKLARQLDLPEVVSDALDTRSCALAARGEPWEAEMREALDLARATRSDSKAGRAYANYQVLLGEARRWDELDAITAEGLAYCEEHDIATYGYCIRAAHGDTMLARARWDEAVALAQPLVDLNASPINILSPLCVIGLARARRDQPGGHEALDRAVELADRTGDLEWQVIARLPRAEARLLAADLVGARTDLGVCLGPGLSELPLHLVGQLLLWVRRAGLALPAVPGGLETPVALGLADRAPEAAAAWDERDMPYHAAWALFDEATEDSVRQAHDRFDRLGATAAARFARRQLRRLGADSVPSGARAATRAHPAGLTPREQEVLELLADSLTDDQIAARLVLSVRTVHHHVSAVLAKLGVPSRHDAADEAQRRGLVPVD
jgi:DNA-binding CsgD family transcriptional regulator